MIQRSRYSTARAPWAGLFMAALIVAGAATALAQRPGGRGRMSPEQQATVWEAQARTAAKVAALGDDETTKLVEAYAAARKSHGEATQGMFGQGGRGGGGGGAMMEVMQLGQTKASEFAATVKEFLSEDQAAKVLPSLGSFNFQVARQWDRMVAVVGRMELDEAKHGQALGLVNTFAADAAKASDDAISSGDFQSIRTASQEAKTKLDGKMAGVLSEEQLATWNEATQQRRRGGRGGGGGGRRPGGRGGNN